MITKICAIQVACFQQRTKAGISRIVAESGVVAQDAADLLRLVITAEYSAGRNTNCAVKRHMIFHEDIHHAGGK